MNDNDNTNNHDPLQMDPQAQAQLDKIIAEHPEAANHFAEMFANMRQAHHAWKAGQYPTFEDAMEAITGQRPLPVEPDEDTKP